MSIWKGVSKDEKDLQTRNDKGYLDSQENGCSVALSFSDSLNSFVSGFSLTVFNPANALLWLALVSSVVNPWVNKGNLSILAFILALIAGMLIWYFLIVMVVKSFGQFNINNRKVDFYSGILILVFAVYFAFDTLLNKGQITGYLFFN